MKKINPILIFVCLMSIYFCFGNCLHLFAEDIPILENTTEYKLQGNNPFGFQYFGYDVAIYGDYAFTCTPHYESKNDGKHGLFMYKFNGSEWQFLQKYENDYEIAALKASEQFLICGRPYYGSYGDIQIYEILYLL